MLGLSRLRGWCAAVGLLLPLGESLFAGTPSLGPGQPVGGGGSSSSTRFGIVGSIGQAVAASDAATGGRFSARSGLWTHATASFNAPPTLAGATSATIDELMGYTQALVPQDGDVPAQALLVALVSGPAGLVVTNGVLAWTPTEAQGPSTNTVSVSVGDGIVTVTKTFTLVVRGVNTVPLLKVAMEGELILLEWEAGPGWRLEVSGALENARWERWEGSIAVEGGRSAVRVRAASDSMFWRLKQ